jgi:hypothetical protein
MLAAPVVIGVVITAMAFAAVCVLVRAVLVLGHERSPLGL